MMTSKMDKSTKAYLRVKNNSFVIDNNKIANIFIDLYKNDCIVNIAKSHNGDLIW